MKREPTADPPSPSGAANPHSARRWILRIAILVLAGAAVLAALAPTFLSLGVARGYVMSYVNASIPARVEVGDLGLSWLGSQEILKLSIQTQEGQRVARADRVVLDQSILSLLWNSRRIGAVRVEGAEAWVDGLMQFQESIAKEARARPPAPAAPAAPRPPMIPATVRADNVTLYGRAGNLRITQAVFQNDPSNENLQTLEAAWTLESGDRRGAGTLEGTVGGLRTDWRGWDALAVTATVKSREAFPLEAVWGVAADFGSPFGGGGSLTTTAKFSRTQAGDMEVDATCDAASVTVTGPALSGDTLALATLHLKLAAAWTAAERRVEIRTLELLTPVAEATAGGTFALATHDAGLPTGDLTASFTVHVAPLAQMLPHALGQKEGMSVQSGEVKAGFTMGADEKTAWLRLTAGVEKLTGRFGGREHTITDTTLKTYVMRERRPPAERKRGRPDLLALVRSLDVKEFLLKGPFGEVAANGRMESFTLDANLNLTETTQQVAQFLDLAGRSAAGTAVFHVKTQGDFATGVRMGVNADLAGLDLQLGGNRTWQEPRATLNSVCTLSFDESRELSGVSLADFAYAGSPGGVRAKAEFKRTQDGWTFSGAANGAGDIGELALAVSRLRGQPSPRAGGRWELTTTAQGILERRAAFAATGRTTDLAISTGTEGAAPARVEDATFAADARYEYAAARQLTVNALKAQAPGLSVDVKGAATFPSAGSGALQAQGEARATANLEKLSQVLRPFGILPEGVQFAGTVTATATGAPQAAGGQPVTVTAEARDLRVALPDGVAWQDPRVSLSAAGDVTLGADGQLAALGVKNLIVESTTAHVEGEGNLTRAGGPWSYRIAAKGNGNIARTAAAAYLAVHQEEPKEKPRAKVGGGTLLTVDVTRLNAADWRLLLKEIGQRASGEAGQPPEAGWRAEAQVQGTDKTLAVDLASAQLDHLAVTEGAGRPASVRITEAVAAGSVRHEEDGSWRFAAKTCKVLSPELSMTASGDAVLPASLDPGAMTGSGAVDATADLAPLVAAFPSLNALPDAPQAAGTVKIALKADAGQDRRVLANVKVDAADLQVKWAEGRGVSEPTVAADADVAIRRDDAGRVIGASAARWDLKTGAGALTGTAAADRAGERWTYDVTYVGSGSVGPLAQTIARASGGKPGAITGQWQAKGRYQQSGSAEQKVEVAAEAKNLVIPQEGKGAEADVRLADARVNGSAVFAADGSIEIRVPELVGPGLEASANGTLRLPGESAKSLAADGKVAIRKADLAELAKALRPFGILPAQLDMQGIATFSGAVSSSAEGFAGSGDLAVTRLGVNMVDSQMKIDEPAVQMSLKLAHNTARKEWTGAVTIAKGSLATGKASGSVNLAEAQSRIDVECDLVCDGKRLTDLLIAPPEGNPKGPRNPRFGGSWRIAGRAGGPLAESGAWNRRIAGLKGAGTLQAGNFAYDAGKTETLSGGGGALSWQMANGGLFLTPDPARRMTLAEGTVYIGGVIDLRGPEARWLVTRPMRVLENVPLSDPAIKSYLEFGSPILAQGAIDPNGRLSAELDTLDLPLASGQAAKTVVVARFTIDRFRMQLKGPVANLLVGSGGAAQTAVQQFGPVQVSLKDSIFYIKEHDMVVNKDTTMKFRGQVGLDRSMNIEVQIPMSAAMLQRFTCPPQVVPYLVGQPISFPMTGTTDKPRLDEKVIGKRIGEMVAEAMKRYAVRELENFLKGGLKKK